MDELSSEAKRLLKLAQAGLPSAGPDARTRVRRGVDAALLGAAAGRPLGQPPHFRGWFGSGKVMLASGLVLLVGGGSLLWVEHRAPVQPAVAAPMTTSAQPDSAQAVAPTQGEQTSGSATFATAHVAPGPVRQRTAPAPSAPPQQLAAEVAVLARADQALAARDLDAAHSALREHRRRFPRPQLGPERDGLTLLARCLQQPGGVQPEARAFLRRSPGSLLVERIQRACALSDGT